MFPSFLFTIVYICSGAAALVYQVAWARLLTLEMGHTVAAASIVLAAFMGGLALGAQLGGGRLAPTSQARRLQAYALLELFVAVSALALPLLLSAAVPLLAWAYADATAPTRFTLVRAAIGLGLVGLPAIAMGATFPLAAAWSTNTTSSAAPAARAGILYAANSAGAAIGAFAAGFWIIPAAGVRGATWTGVALNLIAVGAALYLARSEDASEPEAKPTTVSGASPIVRREKKGRRGSRQPEQVQARPISQPLLACAAAGTSGCVALVYEVTWTRLIALLIGPTTYAFATMAAVFIGGLAVGSTVGVRMARRAGRPSVWLSAMLIASAVCAATAAWLTASKLPLLVSSAVANPRVVFSTLVLQYALMIGAVLFPMTFALGATFPLALAVASTDGATVGRDTARVYVANTIGAIGGALASGFWLIPQFGLRATIHVAAIAGAALGAVCLGFTLAGSKRTGAVFATVIGVAAAAFILLLPPWDRTLLSSGGYLYAAYFQSEDLNALFHANRFEYYKEGAAGTVTVRSMAGIRALAVDGKVDASNGSDMPQQRMLGLLPVLMHQSPDDIGVIGLGSGVTIASAMTPGTVRRADVIEISPEVVEASRLFSRENRDVLSSGNVRLVVGDGRSHIGLTDRRYDVIVSEPSNPWMVGVAALFTREFFESARASLKPNGLLCQWAHTYDISSDDLRSIVRTFTSVFPEATMWVIGESDLVLIGTNGSSIASHLDTLAQQSALDGPRSALNAIGIPPAAMPFTLLSLFALGPQELARYGSGMRIQTDDRMALEFSAPRDLYGHTSNENVAAIKQLVAASQKPPVVQRAYDQATDAGWTARGQLDLAAEAYASAYDAFQRAATLNSRNADALAGWSKAAAVARRRGEQAAWLKARAAAEPDNAVVRIELSRVLAAEGDVKQAIAAAEEAVRIAPAAMGANEALLAVVATSGDAERLASLAGSFAAAFPSSPDAYYYRAIVMLMTGRAADAVREATAIVSEHPDHVRAQKLLGAACLSIRRDDCARTAFEAAIVADPRDAALYVSLGAIHMRAGDPAAAADYFIQGLTLDRSSQAARLGLTNARAALAAR